MTVSVGQSLAFDIVDVFSASVGQGNPAAVIHDADTVDDRRMQEIASWIGLPETVFVVKPTSDRFDFAVRIFAPSCELPFAGHPSLAALCALIARRPDWVGRKHFEMECKAGGVQLSMDAGSGCEIFRFRAPGMPAAETLDAQDDQAVRDCLGLEAATLRCERVSAGAKWIVVQFEDPDVLASARPDLNKILSLSLRHDVSGITAFAPSPDDDAMFEIRSFAPRIGVAEDAACGGGNACVAASLAKDRDRSYSAYTASQGRSLGRNSRIFVQFLADKGLSIGGNSRVFASGTVTI